MLEVLYWGKLLQAAGAALTQRSCSERTFNPILLYALAAMQWADGGVLGYETRSVQRCLQRCNFECDGTHEDRSWLTCRHC